MKITTTLLLTLALTSTADAQSLVREFHGDSTDDWMGFGGAGPGDLNGDGVPDVVVCSPGDAARSVRAYSGATGLHLWSLHGVSPGDGFGYVVTTVEDTDGDGVNELAIPADPGGYTRLYSGSTHLPIHQWNVRSRNVCGIGDVDGDGAGDLAIAGIDEVRVFSGGSKALLHLIPNAHTNWSLSLGGGGDVDGDGHDDFLVGDYWLNTPSGGEGGRVWVYSGLTGGVIHVLDGPGDYEWFGQEVAILGDVDADGFDDFVISASPDFLFSPKAPYATVFSGSDASELYTIPVLDCLAYGLYAVAAVGEVDGDGVPDLMISWNGTCTDTSLQLHSGVDGELIWQTSPSDVFTIEPLGDLDGDGAPEVLVGDFQADPNGSNSGTARVFRVACGPPPTSYCIGAPNTSGSGARLSFEGTPSLSHNGFALSAAGLVPNTFGLFYYGGGTTQTAFGHGFRCVNAGGVGIFRLGPPTLSSGGGTTGRALDFTLPPLDAGPGQATAGTTRYFQYWYRDVPAGPPGFNLTDGLAVTFCP